MLLKYGQLRYLGNILLPSRLPCALVFCCEFFLNPGLFHRVKSGRPPQLYINQFTPSSLNWRAANLRLTQTVSIEPKTNTMVIQIKTKGTSEKIQKPAALLSIRIPAWAERLGFRNGDKKELENLQATKFPFYWSLGIDPSSGLSIVSWPNWEIFLNWKCQIELIPMHRRFLKCISEHVHFWVICISPAKTRLPPHVLNCTRNHLRYKFSSSKWGIHQSPIEIKLLSQMRHYYYREWVST